MDQLRHRDPILAVIGLCLLVAATGRAGRQSLLLSPAGGAVGVGGAVALELLFLRYPGQLLSRWERPGIAVAAATLTVAVGLAALWVVPVLAGVLAWGLLTYLCLAFCVAAGLGNPLAPLAGVDDP